MSKFGDKFKNFFTVDYDDYEDDYYDEYDDEIEAVEKPVRKAREKVSVAEEPVVKSPRTSTFARPKPARVSRSNKVVPMRSNDMEVCVVKPTYYESVREIIDTLLEGKAVVLNLEGVKLDISQRIVDTVYGGCYAIQGNIQRISGYIYLLTPSSVDITGDFQKLANSESSNQTTSYTRSRYE